MALPHTFATLPPGNNPASYFDDNFNALLAWAVAGGPADAITATYTPANTVLDDGLLLGFRASGANTIATPTFSPDGLTAHVVTKLGGSPLVTGDIPAALAECVVRYNLANTRWELMNPAVAASATTAGTVTAAAQPAITSLGTLTALTLAATAQVPIGQNLLPNTNWQLTGTVTWHTAMNSQGTGTQAPVSCTGFSVLNNQPTFTTANTQQLYNGCLVTFPNGNSGLSGTALRVINLVPNTSFDCQLQLGGLSPAASAAITATPLGVGDIIGNTTGAVADGGWGKSVALIAWVDDFETNACVGAKRVLGIRKTNDFFDPEQVVECVITGTDAKRLAGRTVTFGALVRVKRQAGGQAACLFINDSITAISRSSIFTGISYTDPVYGGYQFLSVTQTIAPNATSIAVGFSTGGSSINDVYYLALPTLVPGSLLTRESCGPNPQETLFPNGHWNPPMLTPLATTMPVAFWPGTALYGWSDTQCDLEAMSYGTMHHSVKAVKCKIEFQTNTPGAAIFTGSTITIATGGLSFGPQQYTQAAGVKIVGQGWWPLDPNGNGCIFTNVSGLVITNATFDFDLVEL